MTDASCEAVANTLDDLKEAIQRNDELALIELVNDLHPADIGEVIGELDAAEATVLYKVLDADRASDVLTYMEEDRREKFLASLSPKEIAEQLIDNLDSDDAADEPRWEADKFCCLVWLFCCCCWWVWACVDLRSS